MAKYKYPCAFWYDKNDKCWYAEFPDWQEDVVGCTYGKTWHQVLYMADDLLNLMCYGHEEDKKKFPVAHKYKSTKERYYKDVEADTDKYRKVIAFANNRHYRFRMAEKAREKYWYHKPPFDPEDWNVE